MAGPAVDQWPIGAKLDLPAPPPRTWSGTSTPPPERFCKHRLWLSSPGLSAASGEEQYVAEATPPPYTAQYRDAETITGRVQTPSLCSPTLGYVLRVRYFGEVVSESSNYFRLSYDEVYWCVEPHSNEGGVILNVIAWNGQRHIPFPDTHCCVDTHTPTHTHTHTHMWVCVVRNWPFSVTPFIFTSSPQSSWQNSLVELPTISTLDANVNLDFNVLRIQVFLQFYF